MTPENGGTSGTEEVAARIRARLEQRPGRHRSAGVTCLPRSSRRSALPAGKWRCRQASPRGTSSSRGPSRCRCCSTSTASRSRRRAPSLSEAFNLSDTQFGWVLRPSPSVMRSFRRQRGCWPIDMARVARARAHRRVVVGVHRADGPRVGFCLAAAVQICVRRGRSRRVSDVRQSFLCVAADRRARVGAGHQLFRLASRRGLCASRSGVADRDSRMARCIRHPWCNRPGVGRRVVRVVPQHACGSIPACRRPNAGSSPAAVLLAGCGSSRRGAAGAYVMALAERAGRHGPVLRVEFHVLFLSDLAVSASAAHLSARCAVHRRAGRSTAAHRRAHSATGSAARSSIRCIAAADGASRVSIRRFVVSSCLRWDFWPVSRFTRRFPPCCVGRSRCSDRT